MAPQSRLTVRLMDFPDPELQAASFGAALTSTVPIVAEQAMYVVVADAVLWRRLGECGDPDARDDGALRRGRHGPFFDEFLLLINPSRDGRGDRHDSLSPA